MSTKLEVPLEDATRADWLALKELVGVDNVRLPADGTAGADVFSKYGEPATATVLVGLVGVAVAGFSAWLAKGRKFHRHWKTISVRTPDGTVVKIEMSDLSLDEKEASEKLVERFNGILADTLDAAPDQKANSGTPPPVTG
jgi:hypothetical protein